MKMALRLSANQKPASSPLSLTGQGRVHACLWICSLQHLEYLTTSNYRQGCGGNWVELDSSMLFSLNVMETIKKLFFFYMAFAFDICQLLRGNINHKTDHASKYLAKKNNSCTTKFKRVKTALVCPSFQNWSYQSVSAGQRNIVLQHNKTKAYHWINFEHWKTISQVLKYQIPSCSVTGFFFFCRIYKLQNAWHFFSKNMEWNLM